MKGPDAVSSAQAVRSKVRATGMIRWAVLLSLVAGHAHARVLEVGEAAPFKTPSAAAAAARDGDTVAIQPGSYTDCAVWTANRLIVEGVGDAATVIVRDKICQGKAIFIAVGEGITIRNLTLTHASVPDGNGAGVRGEGRNLSVDGVRFIENQNGILSGTRGGTTAIRDSLFERNGTCQSACAHGLYVGEVDLLRVENSRFIGTRQGHHIKSRARRTEIVGCTIADGPDGTASYAIELPNGGDLLARGNTIEKGPRSGNHTAAIAIGAEGVTHPTAEISIDENSFRNDGPWETAFVKNLTATAAELRGNRLVGHVVPLRGDGQVLDGR